MYEFMVKARPLEAGELEALRRIAFPRPPGAASALVLAGEDLHELDEAIRSVPDPPPSAVLEGRQHLAVGPPRQPSLR